MSPWSFWYINLFIPPPLCLYVSPTSFRLWNKHEIILLTYQIRAWTTLSTTTQRNCLLSFYWNKQITSSKAKEKSCLCTLLLAILTNFKNASSSPLPISYRRKENSLPNVTIPEPDIQYRQCLNSRTKGNNNTRIAKMFIYGQIHQQERRRGKDYSIY